MPSNQINNILNTMIDESSLESLALSGALSSPVHPSLAPGPGPGRAAQAHGVGSLANHVVIQLGGGRRPEGHSG
jgi:hypothetical protein